MSKQADHDLSSFPVDGLGISGSLNSSGHPVDDDRAVEEVIMTKKKHLFVYLMPYASADRCMRYSIQSVPHESLIVDAEDEETSSDQHCKEDHADSELEVVLTVTDRDEYGVGCVNIGTRVFLVGGLKHDDDKYPAYIYTPRSLSCDLHCYDLTPYKQLVHLRTSSSVAGNGDHGGGIPIPLPEFHLKKEKLGGMHAGMSTPILEEIDGLLYVLCGPCMLAGNYIPDPSSEVYDPRTNECSPLENPPFYEYCSKYYFNRVCRPFSHVVIDKKLCVSTQYASFAYDTRSGKWETCELFVGFKVDRLSIPWEENEFCRRLESDRPYAMDDIKCGPPFAFHQKAVVYDGDILICNLPEETAHPLVAYQLGANGKVVRMQTLIAVEWWMCDYLADLGGGFFCYMYHTAMWREDKSDLTLVTFKVSRIVGGAVGADGHRDAKFLTCKVISKFTKKIKSLGTCYPTYSFEL